MVPCLLRAPLQSLWGGVLFKKLKLGRKEPSRSFQHSGVEAASSHNLERHLILLSVLCLSPLPTSPLPLDLGSSGLGQLCCAKRPQGPRPPAALQFPLRKGPAYAA